MNNQQPLINSSSTTSPINRRFSSLITRDADPNLLKQVRTGLIKTPKQLSSRFLYDAEGSRIFPKIMRSPEYYLTRLEYTILNKHKADLLHLFTDSSDPNQMPSAS